MEKHIHGGDVYHHQGCIDFSANCNPLGTPEGIKKAIIESLPPAQTPFSHSGEKTPPGNPHYIMPVGILQKSEPAIT